MKIALLILSYLVNQIVKILSIKQCLTHQLNIFYQLKDLIIHYSNANINYTWSFFFSNNQGYLIHTPGTLFSVCLFYLISIFIWLVLSWYHCKCVLARTWIKKTHIARVTVRDLSRKVNHLSKITWDKKNYNRVHQVYHFH